MKNIPTLSSTIHKDVTISLTNFRKSCPKQKEREEIMKRIRRILKRDENWQKKVKNT